MPELPAMENFRRSIEKESLGKKIVGVRVKKDRVVKDTEAALSNSLTGKKLTKAERHGKYVFIGAGSGKKMSWVSFHCGMTGYFTFPNDGEDEKTLSKAKLLLTFSDKTMLAFFDPRMFGRVEMIASPEDFTAHHKLGPDAITVDAEDFGEMLAATSTTLKAFFLDQSNVAGIGNVYGDEIPFHAKLSPKRKADSLTKAETTRLHNALIKILQTAIDKKAYLDHWDMLPKSWLVHYREAGTACPRCQSKIEAYKAGGRDGYWCPGCQK